MTKPAPWITWGPSEENLVLFDHREGCYHMLNATASLIWKLLSSGQQQDEIFNTLCSLYGASSGVVATDIDAFVRSATKKGLIVIE